MSASTNHCVDNCKPRIRIMCVESDEDSRLMMSALFELAGYEVRTASGVVDGVQLVIRGGYDLITLDGWLKDGTGVEICKKVRLFDSGTPIVFYSGLGFDADQERGRSAGAQAYVVKPDIPKLLVTVERLTFAKGTEAVGDLSPLPARISKPALRIADSLIPIER